jgi:predicted MPP superfamily phosphohydrolase
MRLVRVKESDGMRRWMLPAAMAAGIGVAGAGGAGYAFGVEPAWIEIVPVQVTLPRLAPSFTGYRIVQLSDMHLGDGLGRRRLEAIVRRANAQRPDLIALTGDFVTRAAERHAADLVAGLSRLRAGDGVVAVLGNHDYQAGAAAIRAALSASGIRELGNATWALERDGVLLHLAGVDDIWEGKDRLDLVLARLPREGAAVLLAHEPDFADASAATGRFDLQISGHSHGGQVVMPFYGPLYLPPYAERYPSGRYQVGRMVQYTNRGVGTLGRPVRFNCRPEITVFTLVAAKASG